MKTVFFFFTAMTLMVLSVAMTHAEPDQSAPLFASISDIRSILPESADQWRLIKNDQGIKLYQKNNATHNTYKSECIINLPASTIYKALYNIPKHINWVQYCSNSKIIKKISANEMIHYYSFDLPWPFENRDMVLNTFSQTYPEKKEIRIYGSACPQASIPVKKDYRRITQSTHEWVLTEIYPGSTRVIYKSQTILNDAMPAFFAEHLLSSMPHTMLQNLKEIALRDVYDPSARYLANAEKED